MDQFSWAVGWKPPKMSHTCKCCCGQCRNVVYNAQPSVSSCCLTNGFVHTDIKYLYFDQKVFLQDSSLQKKKKKRQSKSFKNLLFPSLTHLGVPCFGNYKNQESLLFILLPERYIQSFFFFYILRNKAKPLNHFWNKSLRTPKPNGSTKNVSLHFSFLEMKIQCLLLKQMCSKHKRFPTMIYSWQNCMQSSSVACKKAF